MLEVGDVFRLKNGMTVYTDVPEKFVYSDRKFSDELTESKIIVGAVFDSETIIGDLSKITIGIANRVVKEFERDGIKLSLEDIKDFVDSKIIEAKQSQKILTFTLEPGDFVVTCTSKEGGGTGHGSNDIYPDGHRVFCKRIKDDNTIDEFEPQISFYQTGCFTVMLVDIEPIRKVKLLLQVV